MKGKILFYAPIGKDSPPELIGGAEAGCLKTMAIYQDAGLNIIHINRPKSKSGLIKYILGMIGAPIKLTLLCLRHPKSVVHIVGFYNRTVVQEKLMVFIGKSLGHNVIYEPRNGSMINSFNNGNRAYQRNLSYLLCKPNVVLCQGLEYVKFMKDKYEKEGCYYPNFIMNEFIKPYNPDRGSIIRIIYFGRVVPEKNVDVVIKSVALLKKSGLDVTLSIIGGYTKDYKKWLDSIIEIEGLDGVVSFYGRKPFPFIADVLRESHYYIFPSTEKNEGHSNSLTEAMGCGVVPIVSTAGFNVSICGNPDLVAYDINPESYADIIIKIEASHKWTEYSKYCYRRILNNYTQSIVRENLLNYIKPLFNNK